MKRRFKDPQRQKLYDQCLEKLTNGLGDSLSDINCNRLIQIIIDGNVVNQIMWEGIHWPMISQRFPLRKHDTKAFFYVCFAAGRDWAEQNLKTKETPCTN